jgi:hypothetical protein
VLALVVGEDAAGVGDEVALLAAQEIGLELLLAAHLGGRLLPRQDFEDHARFELCIEGASLPLGCHIRSLPVDPSYLIILSVHVEGRTTMLVLLRLRRFKQVWVVMNQSVDATSLE